MKITEYGNNKKPRKMTQIELIKAEIERILNLFPKKPNGEVLPIDQNAYNLISDLKIFIESLPAEQPGEELEYLATSLEETISTSPHSRETIISYLQQAAQWQKEQMINKACKWLNENIVEYHPRTGKFRPIVNINAFREAMED